MRRTTNDTILLASKREVKEVRNNPSHILHFVLLYKDEVILPNDSPPLPPIIATILQEFADVFPDELPPGLPPLRGIEHRIDLIPGAQLPNRAPYRTNPEETKEIQRQVQQLLDKGYVRESLSPCAVPVILVPKQDGTWRMCCDCRLMRSIQRTSPWTWASRQRTRTSSIQR